MLPGPTLIRRCSLCSKPILQDTISSGNTFGACWWTDGKMEAPMMPDEPWLVKCPHCGALIWIDEQKEAGNTWEANKEDDLVKDAQPCEVPSFQDYLAKLKTRVSDRKKMRYLRVRAWWAGNDARREVDQDIPYRQEELANLRVLARQLDETKDEERVMKAEAMRELGDFEQCLALLSKPAGEGLVEATEIIKRLAARRIPFVRKLETA